MVEAGGRIITFYSYKGGTGRTMALANGAWILASAGRRVLMIDWDLEAPGLHRYFHPFLTDKTLVSTKGVIDMVFEYQRAVLALEGVETIRELPDTWYDENIDVFRYITELDWNAERQPGFGTLHLLPAGQQTVDYGARVNTFNWRQLFDKGGGYKFIEAIKRQLTREYDYVFVDSRTGVSDTSGLCTVQMPHALVVCFTLNSQSIDGASTVALGVRDDRATVLQKNGGTPNAARTDGKPFRVYPVPTRVEKAEKQKLDLARDAARTVFDTFVSWLDPAERERYWGNVEIFYEPFYAYEEVLATFADKPGAITSLLASIERLVGYITDGEVRMPAIRESVRQELLARYERQRTAADDPVLRARAVLQRLTTEDVESARAIFLRLCDVGAGGSIVRRMVATADVPNHVVLNRLVDEGLLTRQLGDEQVEYVTIADERLLRWPTLRGWVREYDEALKIRPMLEDLAARWQQKDRSPEFLLRGDAHAAAVRAFQDQRLFSPTVEQFINAGRREENARLRGRRRLTLYRWGIVIAVLAIAVFLSFGYLHQRWRDYQILRAATTKINPVDGLKYVWLEPGDFEMGCSYDSSRDCYSSRVKIPTGFWIGQTEVTNAAYGRYLKAHGQAVKETKDEQLPAGSISWFDAVDYCAWIGGRLPTEEQWEYAARGGVRGARFVTGERLDESQVSLGKAPRSVASHSPNGFGLFDMTGSVAEWTSQNVGFRYGEPNSLRTSLLVRGGSYASVSRELELHFATVAPYNAQDPTIGFRCVLEGTDLEQVARSYRINPFFELYSGYMQQDPYARAFYKSWWDAVYLRALDVEERQKQK
jgi:formylglycine-generating enzyme required for sulfatase activity/Mrp family chromosome partitioning ATPase